MENDIQLFNFSLFNEDKHPPPLLCWSLLFGESDRDTDELCVGQLQHPYQSLLPPGHKQGAGLKVRQKYPDAAGTVGGLACDSTVPRLPPFDFLWTGEVTPTSESLCILEDLYLI